MNTELKGIYIIAGGQSTRMGEDKRLLKLGGRPMLNIMIDLVRDTFNLEPVLVGNNPASARNFHWISDIHAGNGPIYGVITALQHALHGWAMILAGDMPLLTSSDLKVLADHLNNDHHVVTLGVNGTPEPLCGIYRVSTATFWESQLLRGNLSLLDGIRELKARVITPPSGSEALFNVNDLNDLELAIKLMKTRDR